MLWLLTWSTYSSRTWRPLAAVAGKGQMDAQTLLYRRERRLGRRVGVAIPFAEAPGSAWGPRAFSQALAVPSVLAHPRELSEGSSAAYGSPRSPMTPKGLQLGPAQRSHLCRRGCAPPGADDHTSPDQVAQ